MDERYIKWIPVDRLTAGYNIDELTTTINECRIVLREMDLQDLAKEINRYVRVTFFKSMLAYRFTDESFRIGSMPPRGGPWTFYKVENSQYIKSILPHNYQKTLSLMHFSLVAFDAVLDIIAMTEPHIELLAGD